MTDFSTFACEAASPPTDGRIGYDPRPCGEPAVGMRPMRSVRGGYAKGPDRVTVPMYACGDHYFADRVYGFEPGA